MALTPPPTPAVSEESFFASKTMILLMVTAGLIVFLIFVGVAVLVIFNVDAFNLIAAGIGALTGQSLGGVYRNTKVDGPIRVAQAGATYGPPTAVIQDAESVEVNR